MPSTLPQEDSQGSALEPPQFSLRLLLWSMTAVGCLLGVMVAVGKFAALTLAFFIFLVLAHIVGNAVGTRLRDRASRATPISDSESASDVPISPPIGVAGPERLTQRTRLTRITPIITVGGALIGGTLGGTRFFDMYPDSGWGAVTLGVVSSAVLGGFIAFVTSSFISVFRQAMREALADCEPLSPVHKPR